MASDEDYMAFLDKANRDPSEGYAKPQSGGGGSGAMEFKTTDDGVEMPKVLKEATREAFYVSDADEPFVPFALGFKGQGLPDEGMFYVSPFFFCFLFRQFSYFTPLSSSSITSW